MNPFLHNTVAVPMPTRPPGSWQFPFARASRKQLSRQAGVVAMAAGMGMGMPAQAVDVNHAITSQLQGVRGVGPRMAQTIVDERERAGRFESLEDLSDRVRGIGRKRLQSLRAAGLRIGTGRDPDNARGEGKAGAAVHSGRTAVAASHRAQPQLTNVPEIP